MGDSTTVTSSPTHCMLIALVLFYILYNLYKNGETVLCSFTSSVRPGVDKWQCSISRFSWHCWKQVEECFVHSACRFWV